MKTGNQQIKNWYLKKVNKANTTLGRPKKVKREDANHDTRYHYKSSSH